MWKLELRPRYSFSGNICFQFSAFCLCSVGSLLFWRACCCWLSVLLSQGCFRCCCFFWRPFPALACSSLLLMGVERQDFIEGNEKCRHLKKLTCKETLRQVFICLRPRTPYPPPYTLYICVIVYSDQSAICHRQRKPERLEGLVREGGHLISAHRHSCVCVVLDERLDESLQK